MSEVGAAMFANSTYANTMRLLEIYWKSTSRFPGGIRVLLYLVLLLHVSGVPNTVARRTALSNAYSNIYFVFGKIFGIAGYRTLQRIKLQTAV